MIKVNVQSAIRGIAFKMEDVRLLLLLMQIVKHLLEKFAKNATEDFIIILMKRYAKE